MVVRKVFLAACATAMLTFVSGIATADTWFEVGDAPSGVPDRQDTVGAGPLNFIVGETGGNDFEDTYSIIISNVDAFFATTVGSADWDTRLYLWDSAGNPILGNDDDPVSGTLQSFISHPDNFPGDVNGPIPNIVEGKKYLLTITGFNNQPLDAGGERVIDLNTDFNGLNGPNPNAGPFANWEGVGAQGAYTIQLGGAHFCIPEPTSAGLLALGLIGLVCTRRRR